MHAVIEYLSKINPEAAARARKRYGCFDHVAVTPQPYDYLSSVGINEIYIKDSIEQLIEMQHMAFEHVKKDAWWEVLSHAFMIEENFFKNLNRAPRFLRRSLVRYSDICKPPYVGSTPHILQRRINYLAVWQR